MTGRAVCIHGHFYQPPREDPWTGEIEPQPSAAPYHDWNERITAECYGPNTAARILDSSGRIEALVDNFSRISFDVGPTLLSWLEEHAPRVYAAILAADRESARRFSGHGSAMAQAYHHAILPLSDSRDRRTEVVWGIRDFESRFGRFPEGMWLPETAADVETLETLAELGIRFTVLAPRQAARVRPVGGAEWADVSGEKVDTTRPYFVPLPSGRRIAVFFYDGAVSRAIAFERLLDSAENFVSRLLGGETDGLRHVATDGESYGHHHEHGDMALAAALARIERGPDARLTNYGEHLERRPPQDEVEIVPRSSWSCEHGVGRWERDCGCRVAGGSQLWRAPMREAFDWLRDEILPRFEARAGELLADPWKARDEALPLFRDGRKGEESFFAWHARRPLTRGERGEAFRLLDLQRQALRMYTSCGWFFDDVAGLEARQVIRYAARALEIAEELFREALEPRFLEILRQARGNSAELPDGAAVYERYVDTPGLRHPPHHEERDPGRSMSRAVTGLAEGFANDPTDARLLEAWRKVAALSSGLPFPVDLWSAQNVYYRLQEGIARTLRKQASAGDVAAAAWLAEFEKLGELLGFTPTR